MKTYLKIYRWSMRMKLRLGIYSLALLFCKMVWNLKNGIESVRSLDILTIWITCLCFSILETVILPEYEYSPVRTAVWAAAANISIILGACLSGWFTGMSPKGVLLLLLFLQICLFLMWVGDNVAMRADTAQLNNQLVKFQNKRKGDEMI